MYNVVNVQVEPPLFTVDDDVLPSIVEGQTGPDACLALEPRNLLSVDELLDAVSHCVD